MTIPSAEPNEVSIDINGASYVGWKTISISRSVEAMPNAFTVTGSEVFLDDPTKIIAQPGTPCTVKIGSDSVVTGIVDRYIPSITGRSHEVTITGRGLCRELVDCSADIINSPDLKLGSVTAPNVLALATMLAAPFKIKAQCAVANLGPMIPRFQIALGETPYEVIAKVAQYCGFLVYENEYGAVVLDQVGTNQHVSGFAQGVNIEAASISLSIDQRFSNYTVVLNSTFQAAEVGILTNLRASVSDATVPQYRPRIIVSEQTLNSKSNDPQVVALARANWELARRIGRSQVMQVTCDSWRDANGYLWTPNWLAPIAAPSLKLVSALWVIGSVVFRKDSSGTHADLVLMPPAAFTPEPTSLNLFDLEIQNAVPNSAAAQTAAAQRNVGQNQ